MAMEVEKMAAIQERANETERKEISGIINQLSSDFQMMLRDSRTYILTGEKVTRDLSESLAALKKLKEYGDSYGEEFPLIETHEQAAVYILQFGREITMG